MKAIKFSMFFTILFSMATSFAAEINANIELSAIDIDAEFWVGKLDKIEEDDLSTRENTPYSSVRSTPYGSRRNSLDGSESECFLQQWNDHLDCLPSVDDLGTSKPASSKRAKAGQNFSEKPSGLQVSKPIDIPGRIVLSDCSQELLECDQSAEELETLRQCYEAFLGPLEAPIKKTSGCLDLPRLAEEDN